MSGIRPIAKHSMNTPTLSEPPSGCGWFPNGEVAPGRNDCATPQKQSRNWPFCFMRLFVIGIPIIASWQVGMDRQRVIGNSLKVNLQVRVISINTATMRRQNLVANPPFLLTDRSRLGQASQPFPQGGQSEVKEGTFLQGPREM